MSLREPNKVAIVATNFGLYGSYIIWDVYAVKAGQPRRKWMLLHQSYLRAERAELSGPIRDGSNNDSVYDLELARHPAERRAELAAQLAAVPGPLDCTFPARADKDITRLHDIRGTVQVVLDHLYALFIHVTLPHIGRIHLWMRQEKLSLAAALRRQQLLHPMEHSSALLRQLAGDARQRKMRDLQASVRLLQLLDQEGVEFVDMVGPYRTAYATAEKPPDAASADREKARLKRLKDKMLATGNDAEKLAASRMAHLGRGHETIAIDAELRTLLHFQIDRESLEDFLGGKSDAGELTVEV